MSPEETRAVIPLLPDMFDEPFADYSQIPTYLVSKMARRDVTVSLSGDGGDEVFGGYTRYLAIDGMWRTTGMIPSGLRAIAGSALRAVPPSRVRRGERLRAGAVSSVASRRQDPQGRRYPEPALA